MAFKKGQTGNPGGRPKGLAESVRALVPANRLVETHMLIAWEPAQKVKTDLGAYPSIKDRQASMEWLAERGWGKSVQSMDVAGEVVIRWLS